MEAHATIFPEVSSFVHAPTGTLGYSVKARRANQILVRQITPWNATLQNKEGDFNVFVELDILENDAKLKIANFK
jgi:hypothetical protein